MVPVPGEVIWIANQRSESIVRAQSVSRGLVPKALRGKANKAAAERVFMMITSDADAGD